MVSYFRSRKDVDFYHNITITTGCMGFRFKYVFTIIFLFGIWSNANCQFYQNAAGIRLGPSPGLSGKTLFTKKLALEGMITTRWGGVNITGLVEVTQAMMPPDILGLSWYYGLGANIGFWDYQEDDEKSTSLFVGADGIVGAEYTFENIPLNLALDWKPYFNFISHAHFVGDEFAISARYVFNY